MPHGLLSSFTMNSLNIITSRVSPSASPAQSRSNSLGSIGIEEDTSRDQSDEKSDHHDTEPFPDGHFGGESYDDDKPAGTEDTPLLGEGRRRSRWWHTLPRDIVAGIIGSIRWVFANLASPGVYLIACFYDADGNFAPTTQLKKLFGVHKGNPAKLAAHEAHAVVRKDGRARALNSRASQSSSRPVPSSGSSSSGFSSESEEELRNNKGRHMRSQSLQPADETNTSRRSIRIKLHNEDVQPGKHRKTHSAVTRTKASDLGDDIAAHLKSPTSPIAALTKYPKTPAPPRPLIPRRQPSYLNIEPTQRQQKTLILDLDETLIHSMSKGGMNSGHMVEVRLNTASLGMHGGGPGPAGQHPILYWVNKRPYCDEFLRRVCKWYNLVIFTASVQEYADPVIDWLESERKFFSARYYRQHCTYRQGAYIKDLSSVEPDLSKVMILDNSPLSYLFHAGQSSLASGAADSMTNTIRQRSTHPRLDQRPDRQRSHAPSATSRRPAIRPRRTGAAGATRRRGRAAHALEQGASGTASFIVR